jgi:hypothetical protein
LDKRAEINRFIMSPELRRADRDRAGGAGCGHGTQDSFGPVVPEGSEGGRIPEHYPLQAASSKEYPVRTRLNVFNYSTQDTI